MEIIPAHMSPIMTVHLGGFLPKGLDFNIFLKNDLLKLENRRFPKNCC